jgi:iduronate 2-sulfatase
VSGNYTTLPQHFKDHGYVTQSVGKIFHPGSASGGTDDYPYSWSYPAFHAPTEKYTSDKVRVCLID